METLCTCDSMVDAVSHFSPVVEKLRSVMFVQSSLVFSV